MKYTIECWYKGRRSTMNVTKKYLRRISRRMRVKPFILDGTKYLILNFN